MLPSGVTFLCEPFLVCFAFICLYTITFGLVWGLNEIGCVLVLFCVKHIRPPCFTPHPDPSNIYSSHQLCFAVHGLGG